MAKESGNRARGKDPQVTGFISELKEQDEEISYKIAESLKIIGSRAKLSTLTRILLISLKDDNAQVRQAAAKGLRWVAWNGSGELLSGSEDLKTIIEATGDRDSIVRREAVSTLGFLGNWAKEVSHAGGIERLLELLGDTDLVIKKKAVWALGEMIMGGEAGLILRERGYSLLLRTASQGGVALFKEIELTLRKVLESSSGTFLIPMLIGTAGNSELKKLRLLAVRVLAANPSSEVLAALEKVVERDRDPDVAETADIILQRAQHRH